MSGILQGFMNPAPVKTSNQGRGPWPKRPRRVGARTRPGLEQRMLAINRGQHKSAALTACKAARTTCKDRVVPPARIHEKRQTAAAPQMSPLAALTSFSSHAGPNTGSKHASRGETTYQIAGFCKPARVSGETRLQGRAARTGCKAEVGA